MARRHEHIFQLTQDWIAWNDSRKYLGRPKAKNILLKLCSYTNSSDFEADGVMSAEICAFNMAFNNIDRNRLIPFVVIYCKVKPKPIVLLAEELGISRTQFYDLAHSVALEIYAHAMKIVEAS